jgi:hypothetical protein
MTIRHDKIKNGDRLCILNGSDEAIEKWIKAVSEKANTKLDCCRDNGHVYVFHMGNTAYRERAIKAINSLKTNRLGVTISCRYV